MPTASNAAMNQDLKEYIDQRDTVVEQKIKLWILTSVLAQVLTLVATLAPIIFYLGGIYQNANRSIELLNAQSQFASDASRRLAGIEEQQREARAWMKSKGFVPFTPDTPGTPGTPVK
jgi:hypothetical protein